MNDFKALSVGNGDAEKDMEIEKQGAHGFVEEPVVTVIEIDPAMERRVKRKIDMIILPIFGFIFMFQYLDKIALSYAVIFGMKTDLNLQGQDYSWCNSIFYFGQFFFEYFAVYLLHRFPIKKFVGVTILAWGIVMMCLAATKNFTGLMIGRFFLGACEGAVSPAFVIMTSIFWRKAEHPLRYVEKNYLPAKDLRSTFALFVSLACFVSMNAFAQIAGGLLLYGCGSITNAAIDGWRISFLLAGGITILLGGVFVLIIPVSPGTAWFLNAEERVVAEQRVAQEHASAQHATFQWDQAIATLKDVKFWLIFLWALMITITSVVV
ncbi:hypothetical protein QFC21_003762 [Naganishia friedmannii]|uniref:Uncharacterized protein n=1 Tax=Naganishia friedmannii TaxID=89922 RepID=A0ACC2VL94_9TREE|nr:hypothetical protein QFC21_003762 [Naganishia friedmannii]